MLTLTTQSLHRLTAPHGLTPEELSSLNQNLPEYLTAIKSKNQGFHTLPDDRETPELIRQFAESVKGKYTDIVVLGIGGSALGPICIQSTLKSFFKKADSATRPPAGGPLSTPSALSPAPGPGLPSVALSKDGSFSEERLHVLDNIDPSLLSEISEYLDYSKTLFIVITKSGTTPETVAQYLFYRNEIQKRNLPVKDHMIFLTDPSKGLLREIARKDGITAFDIPQNVGGRFSVLSSVGLLPAALIGVDIQKMLEGAKEIRESFLNQNPDSNLPFRLAAIQYLLSKKGKTINVTMPYSQKLIRLADWYRQLLGESIGKAVNNKGEKVNVGITPLSALGVTDQHSQTQLFNEGPNDKLIIFIKVNNLGPELKIPDPPAENPELSYLKGITFNRLMEAEMQGTAEAYTANDRPNITIEIDEVNEQNLGALFMLFESATAFLGEMFQINAFDQPGVELSKKITKEILTLHPVNLNP